METLNKEQFVAYGNSKFTHSKLATRSLTITAELGTKNAHFFKKNNVLIQLVHSDIPVKENHLAELKKGDDFGNRDLQDVNHYTSEIKAIHNNHVLIMYNDWENVGYYNVHCWSNIYNHGLTIALQFDLANKAKATQILNDILNGVEFKN